MKKPITDKATVSVDFPDKAYFGIFGRDSSFEVHVDTDEVLLKIENDSDERREVAVHLHYYLLADILKEMAVAVTDEATIDEAHREPLAEGARALADALKKKPSRKKRG
jgi:hypothetical protein